MTLQNLETPSFLSRFLLWEEKTIDLAIKKIEN